MNFAGQLEPGRMDELGRLDSPMHRIDARAKVLATLAFTVAVLSFPRQAVSPLTPFLFYPVTLVALGHIPPRLILRKLFAAAPFALLVGLFNPLVERRPVMALGPVVVTDGWLACLSILLRFALTAGAALALVACTGMHRLGAAMARLGVPRVFVMQILFLYRYLFVVAGQASAMLRGAALRAPGRALPLPAYGAMTGHLLIRSLDRAERVFDAMAARGFDGEVRLLQAPRLRWSDALFLGGCLLFFLAARLRNLPEALGRLIAGGPA